MPAGVEERSLAGHADFCIGYFNLRGWKAIGDLIERWSGGAGIQCRLLVGMRRWLAEVLREAFSIATQSEDQLDNQTALRLNKKLAEEFRDQLTFGAPTNADEIGLSSLAVNVQLDPQGYFPGGSVACPLRLRSVRSFDAQTFHPRPQAARL